MMSTGASYKVLEVGHLRPIGLDPCDELGCGDVGYFTASIKNVEDTRVGDTVTETARPAAEPLPGYRPARSMVYCGIYTEDGSKYPDLRDALEKLKLNDASLSFEPESSVALGFGFRCGFPGMLHMEIIQERLEREFDLDLITTLPSVIYRITKTDGTVLMIDNPHDYPNPASIEVAEEPFVNVSIITPQEFVGNIMPLCQDLRGEYKNMQYLDSRLVELHYEMPLNEIVYNFFDTLKARTKGYASLDYEFSSYHPSELVKVDMLLNGDQVDALSFIAHKDKAYGRARKLCEKLKENIPRQLFEIPVQAAIGGKIIARETVKALRKDVLAKCYGGDITRKKKLLHSNCGLLGRSVDFCAALGADHVRPTFLKIEPGTAFAAQAETLGLPDEDGAADQYLFAVDRLKALGYDQYEISNFARPGRESRHNLQYWRCGSTSGLARRRTRSSMDGGFIYRALSRAFSPAARRWTTARAARFRNTRCLPCV